MHSAVLFDLDGTLVDSAADIARALSSVRCARGGTPVTAANVRPLVSLGATTLIRQTLGSLAADPVDDLAEFRATLSALSADPATIYPGVIDALEALISKGHILAIVTNKPETLSRNLISQLGMADHFRAIIGGDTTGQTKPHPEPVWKALETIRISSDRAIFVGDSPIDAQAARACAIPFVLFEGGYGARECASETIHARFGAFAGLSSIIDGLLLP
jgi:phosphoglycolate phosphatase